MTDVKLSICIPTYNRADYLRTALENLAKADFSFAHEIVISDNASTDNTTEVVQHYVAQGLPITYLRMPENMGAGPNLTNAIQHASGDYMVYQGDDDLLILPKVADVVTYLDANPDVSACHAPWYLYDEVADRDNGKFYRVDDDVKFACQDYGGVFEFIVNRHIFPEIAIYRMSSVRSSFVPRHFCFWPFSYLAHFLDQGAVAFLREPFYRSVTVSRIAPEREQAGFNDAMTAWDMYRGGLEYFLHFAIRRGAMPDTEEARTLYSRTCQIFTALRMAIAIRFWVARHDYIRAYELYTRMAVAGFADHPEVADLRGRLPVLVGLQTLADRVNAVPDIERLIFSDAQDVGELTNTLHELGLSDRITVAGNADADDPSLIAKTAVLVSSDAKAAEYAARGYDAHFIFQESEMTRAILI
ncbi:MAG: glycosyltransferase family 2 protein [Sphingobium sp.]|nr:glycosyltransferase family 2 protein [Sphingobium sp.]MCP5399694.1 glycosyltransferase family 2 protein [Sphingomonas sp.]